MKDYCSPNTSDKISCFDNESLYNIANRFNKQYPGHQIEIPKKIDDTNREDFWRQLNVKINKATGCSTEKCWLKKDFVDPKYEENFKPKYPEEWLNNKNAWLSTYDINNVLKQYEKNSNYKYIGAIPIDFDKKLAIGMCVVNEMCNLNLKNLYLSGIRYIGAVFNLDAHDQPGSHWVSLFINLTNGGIYYFDSYGSVPPKEVIVLMERVRSMGNELLKQNIIALDFFTDEHAVQEKYSYVSDREIMVNTKIHINSSTNIYLDDKLVDIENIVPISTGYVIKLKNKVENNVGILKQFSFHKLYNNIRFQYKGSECGVYSIYFQIESLKGKTFNEILDNIVDDDTINKQRDIYYRT